VVAQKKWRGRLRSWFDRTMDRGTPALIGWLGVTSLVLIVVVSLVVWLFDPDDTETQGGFFQVAWESLLRAMDSGTIGGDTSTHILFLAPMFVVTIGGIFIVSSLIGVLTTGMNSRIEELRKGRSPVLATGHAVVLGCRTRFSP